MKNFNLWAGNTAYRTVLNCAPFQHGCALLFSGSLGIQGVVSDMVSDDVIEVKISGLGALRNDVFAEA